MLRYGLTNSQSNILVNVHGGGLVADFGLSACVSDEPVSSEPGGNQAWMAPELFHDGGHHTKESDIWSVGATILVQ